MGKLKKIVSFDFDDTLCMEDGTVNYSMLNLVREYAKNGYRCYIVTARNKKHELKTWIKANNPKRIRVKDFIKEHDLPIKQCHFLNHQPKGPVLKKIGVFRHYDDRKDELASAEEYGIEAKMCIYDENIKRD